MANLIMLAAAGGSFSSSMTATMERRRLELLMTLKDNVPCAPPPEFLLLLSAQRSIHPLPFPKQVPCSGGMVIRSKEQMGEGEHAPASGSHRRRLNGSASALLAITPLAGTRRAPR